MIGFFEKKGRVSTTLLLIFLLTLLGIDSVPRLTQLIALTGIAAAIWVGVISIHIDGKRG